MPYGPAMLKEFWESYDPSDDMDRQLLELIARAGKHGEGVGVIRGHTAEREVHRRTAAAIDEFVRAYGYGGWLIEHLPPEIVACLAPTTLKWRIPK